MRRHPLTIAISDLNDAFRASAEPTQGRFVLTPGVAAMPLEDQGALLAQIRGQDVFARPNEHQIDRDGEHAFGVVSYKSGNFFWKIEVFEDTSCSEKSAHPEDPAQSYRVLTVMCADEF